MSVAGRLLFLVGLASALPLVTKKPFFGLSDYETTRLLEIISDGFERLERGEEGSYELYNLAHNVLQAFETLTNKVVPKEIKEEDVRLFGFLNLNEKELLEFKGLVFKHWSVYDKRNAEILSRGRKRLEEDQKPNLGNMESGRQVLKCGFKVPIVSDSEVIESGILHLTRWELNEMWINGNKMVASYAELTSQYTVTELQ